ncbi:MAG: GlsB/YeaQ/YmgE family stress response membrane protein [Chitinophagaceae bacterium]|nr:GlsB/YeaQ/YmgE family stress response membrane protein [Chitinophagaceae bacterium]
MEIIVTLLIGAIAGWLGSQIFKGHGLGLVGNIVVGILGSFVGYWLLGKMGVSFGTGWIGAILTGALGAIVILAVINLVFKSAK